MPHAATKGNTVEALVSDHLGNSKKWSGIQKSGREFKKAGRLQQYALVSVPTLEHCTLHPLIMNLMNNITGEYQALSEERLNK